MAVHFTAHKPSLTRKCTRSLAPIRPSGPPLRTFRWHSAASDTAKTRQPVLPYNIPVEEQGGEPVVECATSAVYVDNDSNPNMTRLVIEVPDVPGLLRTMSWTLNGMGVRVQHATLTARDGIASDTLWLTSYAGKKLTDEQAGLLKERVQDFVVACRSTGATPTEWVCHNVQVSNTAHPRWTVFTVRGEPRRQGFLLELSSVISGINACVQEGYIQSGPLTEGGAGGAPASADSGVPQLSPTAVAPPDYDFSEGRYFKFLLSDERGNKLEPAHVATLLFTYDVYVGRHHMPLVAPNLDAYLKQQGGDCGCP